MQISNKILTLDDVKKLNNENGSMVVLTNTAGQFVDVIKNLSPHVRIQIIGGYDSIKKKKYNELRIQERTFYTPSEVCEIIAKFEEYERGIDDSWTDLEKALFIYKSLAENLKYDGSDYVKSRNLTTVLGKGVCAGYAIVFKEAMDRLGIECETINQPRVHTWNAIKIDGKWYPLDLTWEAEDIQKNNADNLYWFGLNPLFNKYKNHNASADEIVADNCFDPKLIADALNKITNSDRYQPIDQIETSEKIYSALLSQALNESEPKKILGGVRKLAKYAFDVKEIYSDTAYVEEFDCKFNEIFQAIKRNKNLTKEQKQSLLQLTNNIWQDVMGHLNNEHEQLRSDILQSLFAINSALANYDLKSIDRNLIKTQLSEALKESTSFGAVDLLKLRKTAQNIKIQMQNIKEAKNQHGIGELNSQIQIEVPTQIVDVQPNSKFNMKKYLLTEISMREALIKGIKESGETLEDAETQSVLDACEKVLECLYFSFKEIEQEEQFVAVNK